MNTTQSSLKKNYKMWLLAVAIITWGCSALVTVKNEKENYAQTEFSYSSENFNFFPDTAYRVPHDITDSNQVALARFAWQEFIALNWPSNYDTISHKRGKPDTTANVLSFLTPSDNYPLVWQTYKHRVEIFPKDTTNYNTEFNTAPQYFYSLENQSSITNLTDASKPILRNITSIFNNLDETSEIDLCTVFVDGDPNSPGASNYSNPQIASALPGAPRRMIYEAKGNQAMFEYVVQNHLYDTLTKAKRVTETSNAITNQQAGAVYPCPDPNQICFPFGKNGGEEGSIEIKATWRQLTLDEYNSGRYLTAPVIYYRQGTLSDSSDTNIYYEIVPAEPTSTSLPFGLVGLHIIHKTKNYPSYVFATFEQVDNLDTTQVYNNLFYYNRNSNPSVNPDKQYAYRYAAILEGTKEVNASVHEQIKTLSPNSVWQYYKLIGVQGKPQNNDNTTDYFLANIVTETNETLRDFSGTLDNDNGTFNPMANNLFQGNKTFVQGGCKGCHGNAQDADFSFITKNAPFEGTPDVINQPLLKTQ